MARQHVAVGATIAVSCLVASFYDAPMRAWLMQRLKRA
jgi:hypothetical protein